MEQRDQQSPQSNIARLVGWSLFGFMTLANQGFLILHTRPGPYFPPNAVKIATLVTPIVWSMPWVDRARQIGSTDPADDADPLLWFCAATVLFSMLHRLGRLIFPRRLHSHDPGDPHLLKIVPFLGYWLVANVLEPGLLIAAGLYGYDAGYNRPVCSYLAAIGGSMVVMNIYWGFQEERKGQGIVDAQIEARNAQYRMRERGL